MAKELQINDGTLGSWVKLYREENPEPEPALKPSDRVRLAELEAEVRELRMENEFLKSRPTLKPSVQHHEPTKAYVARRTAEGKSKRDIIRCVKRYVIREVYHLIKAPTDTQENAAQTS